MHFFKRRIAYAPRSCGKTASLLGLATLALLGLAAAPGQAQTVIIGNIPQANDSFLTAFGNMGSKAQGFTMTSDYLLTSATIRLIVPTGDAADFSLYSNGADNNPDTPLVSFSDPTFSTTAATDYDFTASAPFTLLSGQTYWLVGNTSADTLGIDWLASAPPVTPTGDGATYFGARFSSNSTPPTEISSLINTFAIDGTTPASAASEPYAMAIWAFVGLGAAGLVLKARKKKVAA